ncbi:hypothetical protein [Reichenbachiella versicolor]|uniref:hypothetical protein n=1 Tax=Reichenbachiella versicolor TaxID=1821036 RepID=UPI000D6DF6F2|nr:hypothetical protein [Reichenbachiella versicolor]
MPKDSSDTLFTLIKSLKKSEKRYFKIAVQDDGDKKFAKLFDIIDKQSEHNDSEILNKDKTLKANQLSNMKAHLYNKILQNLRDYNSGTLPNIKIRDTIDHAEILFNKSLYSQCGEVIKKAKKMAVKSDNLELRLEVLKWEKQMLAHSAAKDNVSRTDAVIKEVQEVTGRINNINSFSNLQFRLQSIYKKIGFIRNENDYKEIKKVFEEDIPYFVEANLSIGEKIGLYNLYIGYYFFIQDFETGYEYAKKLVNIFDGQKTLILSRLETYINSLNNLLIAQNKLLKIREFQNTTRELRALNNLPSAYQNENISLKLRKYTFVHEFNRLFLLGDFQGGVNLMTRINPGLETFIPQLDPHSRMILFYKTACLYFGNSDFQIAISWVQKVINSTEGDLREDIHGFARILSLICHYELGNMDLIQYHVRSTYRFLYKKEDLHQFQKYILNFLLKLNMSITEEELKNRFITLRNSLIPLSKDPYEKRAFIYFDIISWLESKIENRPIGDIVKQKAYAILNKH